MKPPCHSIRGGLDTRADSLMGWPRPDVRTIKDRRGLSREELMMPEESPSGVVPASGLPEPEMVTGLSLSAAHDMLDWLERQGCSHLEVKMQADGFSIRCLCPPGFHLERGLDGEVRLRSGDRQ
jgi:hypothetical protein